MIRTGEQFRDSLRDGREVWMNGERIKDVTRHPAFKPLVDIRARIYDMQHEAASRDVMTYEDKGERFAIGNRLPFEQKDWTDKRRAVDAVMHDIGGVVTRVGGRIYDGSVRAQLESLRTRLRSPAARFLLHRGQSALSRGPRNPPQHSLLQCSNCRIARHPRP